MNIKNADTDVDAKEKSKFFSDHVFGVMLTRRCYVVMENAKTRHHSRFYFSQSQWSSAFRTSRGWTHNKRVQHDRVEKCSQNSWRESRQFAVSNIEFHLSTVPYAGEFSDFPHYPSRGKNPVTQYLYMYRWTGENLETREAKYLRIKSIEYFLH